MNLQDIKRFFGNVDYFLLFATFSLCGIGIAAIYSAGVDANGLVVSNEYIKQLLWFFIGIFLLIGASLIDFSRFKDTSWIFFAISVFLLILTLLVGKVVNGSRSWLGFAGLGIQPAEFAKIATVLMLARYLDSSEFDSSFKKLLKTGCILAIPLVLILAQPDFGSALVFFPAAIVMLTLADVDFRYILFGVLSIVGIFIFLSIPLYVQNHPNPILYMLVTQDSILYVVLIFILILSIISSVGWFKFKKPYYYWLSYSLAILAFSIAGATAANKLLKPYQIERLLVFIDPNIDPRGSGWNILQSTTAIGSGGFWGKGFLEGTHSHARYIPQQSTDFLYFSIIAEEFGFVGCMVLFCSLYHHIRQMLRSHGDIERPF